MKNFLNQYKMIVSFIFLVIVIGCIYGYRQYTRKLPDTSKLKVSYKLSAVDMLRQFETDESKATAQYSDKVISIQGIISSVEATDSSGTVFLMGENSKSFVMCLFESNKFQEMLELQKGDSISVKGVCSGYLLDVVMVRCVLE